MLSMRTDTGRVEVEPTTLGVSIRFFGPRGGSLGAMDLPLGNAGAFRSLIEEGEQLAMERMIDLEAGELTAVPELGTH